MQIPAIMGVLNVTPDSFSDGGRFVQLDQALARAHEMVDEGAAVIDVGGESTRPGATPVDPDEELRRVIPVIRGIAEFAAPVRISVDTRHAVVARAAVDAGATLINDVSATLAPVAAETGAGWVAMHMSGTPATMQHAPQYGDVVNEVLDILTERAEAAAALGVAEIWIDPGIGFGKLPEHNVSLLASLDRFVALGWPVLVGASRKTTMGVLTARSDARVQQPAVDLTEPLDRFEASLATATWAMQQGVAMVRAHDVRAHVHAAAVVAGSIAVPSPSEAA